LPSENIEKLIGEIKACRICRDRPDEIQLPHEPRPVVVASSRAPIVICGQAPGTRVHESGKPFDDRSGDRLREWMGVTREAFYDTEKFAIIPMGFCFPGLDAKGGDLPPRKECARSWHGRLFAALPEFSLMLAIGQYAQAYHLRSLRRESLTETVRDWRAIYERTGSRPILPLPHPSWRNTGWLRKNPWFEAEFVPFLQAKVAEMTGGS
jgi:uracil-DNA glycosylase